MKQKITVLGGGNWGTALAKVLAEKGHEVLLWAHEPAVADGINQHHRNPLFLNDMKLPHALHATAELKHAMEFATIIVSTPPSHVLRAVWKKAAAFLKKETIIVSCTKGIEAKTFKLMSQVLSEVLARHSEHQRVVLSGPSFAQEVAKGLPTSVVIAGSDQQITSQIQQLFRTKTFLPFTSQDPMGVQAGGAVKNVIAIAAGIGDGLNLGHSARATIITRGLYEMMKVAVAMGGDPITCAGLSGMGDVILTATSPLSRNYRVGFAIGEGKSINDVLGGTHMVAEGVVTTQAVSAFGHQQSITLPLCDAVCRILDGSLSPQKAVEELTARPLGEELRAVMRS